MQARIERMRSEIAASPLPVAPSPVPASPEAG
jgi:hypothetical protein